MPDTKQLSNNHNQMFGRSVSPSSVQRNLTSVWIYVTVQRANYSISAHGFVTNQSYEAVYLFKFAKEPFSFIGQAVQQLHSHRDHTELKLSSVFSSIS